MASREDKWMDKRCGKITASELDRITSASGRIIDGVVSYIRAKRFERKHGYSLPVTSRQMQIGTETEPMIYEWVKANFPEKAPLLIYSQNLPEIPFFSVDSIPCFGASPDCFNTDQTEVWEFKTLVGAEGIEFFADEYTPYTEKKARVYKEHGDQLLGQFIAMPSVEVIHLVKYIRQDDDILRDTDSPLSAWRGVVFDFQRSDYGASIKAMEERILLINAMIDAPVNPVEFKSGNWVLENGKLTAGV